MIKVKELVAELKKLDQEQYFKVACDEEWNTIYNDFEINKDGEHGAYVIFPLSGSQEESWQDVAEGKYDHNIEPECEHDWESETMVCKKCGIDYHEAK